MIYSFELDLMAGNWMVSDVWTPEWGGQNLQDTLERLGRLASVQSSGGAHPKKSSLESRKNPSTSLNELVALAFGNWSSDATTDSGDNNTLNKSPHIGHEDATNSHVRKWKLPLDTITQKSHATRRGFSYANIWHHGELFQLYIAGDLDSILEMCDLTEGEREQTRLEQNRLSSNGLLAVAIARAETNAQPQDLKLKSIGQFIGLVGLEPTLTGAFKNDIKTALDNPSDKIITAFTPDAVKHTIEHLGLNPLHDRDIFDCHRLHLLDADTKAEMIHDKKIFCHPNQKDLELMSNSLDEAVSLKSQSEAAGERTSTLASANYPLLIHSLLTIFGLILFGLALILSR